MTCSTGVDYYAVRHKIGDYKYSLAKDDGIPERRIISSFMVLLQVHY